MTAKLRLRPWKPGDEAAFTPREDFAAEAAVLGWDWSAGAPGPTWTVCRWSGEVVGIGGLHEIGDGAWDAWACLTPLPRRDWPQLLWLAGKTLAAFLAAGRGQQIRVFVREGFEAGRRCMARLEFADTGLRREWAGGDYAILLREAG